MRLPRCGKGGSGRDTGATGFFAGTDRCGSWREGGFTSQCPFCCPNPPENSPRCALSRRRGCVVSLRSPMQAGRYIAEALLLHRVSCPRSARPLILRLRHPFCRILAGRPSQRKVPATNSRRTYCRGLPKRAASAGSDEDDVLRNAIERNAAYRLGSGGGGMVRRYPAITNVAGSGTRGPKS